MNCVQYHWHWPHMDSRVQNRLACLVTKSPPFTRSVPLLHSLHWLPVRFRLLFKIPLLTYKTLREKSVFMFTPCLPSHWDQTKELVCQSLGSRPTQVQQLFTLVSLLFGTTCRCLSIQPFQLLPSRNISKRISLTGPLPIDTSAPDGLLILNCFIDFALENWFSCHATEPGFTGDIGSIEIWLIDWLIEL